MSQDRETQTTRDHSADDLPQPEPIRFFGTSWVDRSGSYVLRRFALGLGATLLGVAGLLALNITYASFYIADSGSWLTILVVLAFAICSSVAFIRTWLGFRRPTPGDETSFRTIKVIGFVGVLLAYAARSAVEAPGEAMRRERHEAAVAQHQRLHSKRSGNPARRGGGRKNPR